MKPSLQPGASIATATTLEILRRVLAEHGRANLKSYAGILVLMIGVAGCTALSAWFMKHLVNAATAETPSVSIFYFPILVSSLFIVKGLLSYFQEVGVARVGARIVGDVQRRLYDHLLHMDIGFFQRRSSADLITRMSNGANAVRDAIKLAFLGLGRDALTVIGLCVVMIIQDAVLFAIVLATAPLAYLLLRNLSARTKKAAKSEAAGMADIVALTRETSQGVRVLKAYQLEQLLRDRMMGATLAVEAQRNRLARVKAAVAPLSEVLSGLAIGLVILYASWRSQGNPEHIGSLFSFITALLMAGEPLRRLSRLHVDMTTATERIRMLYGLFEEQAADSLTSRQRELVVSRGDVAFDNVSFGYRPTVPVLDRVSFTCPGGKITALVGGSGAGKTTILGLMQGFFIPTSGDITIDGTHLNDVSLASLRGAMSYLDQEAFLFEGTVEENIVGSCTDRDRSRVMEAARFAGADRFIETLAHGYETPIRELASNLSGGQKQRLAIARAFYKNAPLLLLDEPTSALDGATEEHIRQAIFSLAEGRTTVIVAHRLSTIRQADLIHVLDAGRVVESGSHTELMQRGGAYARLFASTLQDGEEGDAAATSQRHRESA